MVLLHRHFPCPQKKLWVQSYLTVTDGLTYASQDPLMGYCVTSVTNSEIVELAERLVPLMPVSMTSEPAVLCLVEAPCPKFYKVPSQIRFLQPKEYGILKAKYKWVIHHL